MKYFFTAIIVFFSFVQQVFSQNNMAVGTNISSVIDYSNEWTFTDAFRMNRGWLTRNTNGQGWDSGKANEMPKDANGYPTVLPFKATDGSQHFAHTLFPAFSKGTYTLVATGKGQLYLRLPNGQGFTENLTGGTFVKTYTINDNISLANSPTGAMYPIILFEIRQSNGTDPIRDIKFIQPSFYNASTKAETQIFHPTFKNSLKHYTLLRFMDFMRTNGSPLQTFSQRTLPTSYTQSSQYGVAIELIAALANELKKDLWICIPHQANDDYVLQIAKMLKSKVNSKLKIYVEYSNETWNTMFSQTTFVQDKGQALNLNSDRWLAGQLYVARRSGEIFNIFETEFGTNNRSRIVNVMASQVSDWVSNQRLNGLADPTINPSGTRADVLAIAPYLGLIKSPSMVCNGTCLPTKDDLLNEAQALINKETKPSVLAQKVIADKYHIPLVCYEGGQHIVGIYEAMNYDALTKNMFAANHDPRMYSIYNEYLNVLKTSGISMFSHFSSCGPWSKYGSWGAIEFQDQSATVAHKYRSIKDWVVNNPYKVDTIKPSNPTVLQATRVLDESINLTWQNATDDIGVNCYVVYVNGKIVGTTQKNSFLIDKLSANTTYSIAVRARDKAVNYSDPVTLSIKTLATPSNLVVANFTGTNPSQNTPWTKTTILSSSISYSGINRGAGTIASSNINNDFAYFVSANSNGTRSSLQESITDKEYIGFTINPISGKALNLNNAKVSLKLKRISGLSPRKYTFFSSVEGFVQGKEWGNIEFTNDYDTTTRSVVVNFPANGYNGLTNPVELRIYGSEAQYYGHTVALRALAVSVFTPVSTFVLGTLTNTNLKYNSLTLNWAAISNMTGFKGYDIFQNGIKINTVPIQNTSFSVTGLLENTAYNYVVKAYDNNGNTIYCSNLLNINTPTVNQSYTLVDFSGLKVPSTLYTQRKFTLSGSNSTSTFSTDVNQEIFNTNVSQNQFKGGFRIDYSPDVAKNNGMVTMRSNTDGWMAGNYITTTDNSLAPSKITQIIVWTKDKFLNTPTNAIVKFDNTNNSILSVNLSNLSVQGKAFRWVIRNGNTYYLSEMLIESIGNYQLNAFSNTSMVGKRWAVFNPNLLTIPSPMPSFNAVNFDNVQEVGFIYEGSRTMYQHTFSMTAFSVKGLVNPVSTKARIGLEEEVNPSFISVYPNPTNNFLNLNLSEKALVELIDIQGKVLKNDVLEAGTKQWQLNNFTAGTYILKATFEESHKTITQKVILQP